MRPAYWAAFSRPFNGGSPPIVLARRTKSQDKGDACMKRERRKNVYLTFVTESEPRAKDRAALGNGYKRKSVYFTFVMESELSAIRWAFALNMAKGEKACT